MGAYLEETTLFPKLDFVLITGTVLFTIEALFVTKLFGDWTFNDVNLTFENPELLPVSRLLMNWLLRVYGDWYIVFIEWLLYPPITRCDPKGCDC